MKVYCLIIMLIALILTGFPAAGSAAGQEFTIVNNSSSDFYDLAITPANSAERGPNVLNGDDLQSGQSLRVVFPNYNSGITQWDILGISCCGEKLKWQQLNLNSARMITLRDGGIAELN
ncbi:hypothetical protein [Sporomusa aerivorans]|uniref:hypothetical protein n=1 Tax=Sporomusa aerivorans TaxID=204936 RepID=UPI00352A33A6